MPDPLSRPIGIDSLRADFRLTTRVNCRQRHHGDANHNKSQNEEMTCWHVSSSIGVSRGTDLGLGGVETVGVRFQHHDRSSSVG